nr:Glucosyl-3-phosphoglycerate synthase [Candidatus Pantoea persica]
MITNFHNLTDRSVESLEKEMVRFARKRKMGLILPSLFSELEGPALGNIVDELAKVPYLDEIVIGLDRADRDQFLYAWEFFSRLPQHHRILWNDGPPTRSWIKRDSVGPLLRSLQKVYGHSDYLDYLASFRYLLSEEFAMRTHVLNNIKIPGD